MAFRHLSTLASTVFDTLPRHTRCGIENSATYVGVRPGTGVGMGIAPLMLVEAKHRTEGHCQCIAC